MIFAAFLIGGVIGVMELMVVRFSGFIPFLEDVGWWKDLQAWCIRVSIFEQM